MDKRPIIVFDSGLGGFSIYRPLRAALPSANILYLADTANFPYGDKSQAWLSARFRQLSKHFADLNPSLLVLACNTATTAIITQLRSSMSCPVVGTEPIIKPLAKYTSSLVLMTASTAASHQTARLMSLYGDRVRLYTPHGLAQAIEYNDYDQVKKSIHEIKKIAQKYQVQAIGLSCTHYPLILPYLKQAMSKIDFLDPSKAVVRQVQRVLRLSQSL